MNQVHWHRHAMLLESMLQQQEFVERSVFAVAFVALSTQNQNQVCPKRDYIQSEHLSNGYLQLGVQKMRWQILQNKQQSFFQAFEKEKTSYV